MKWLFAKLICLIISSIRSSLGDNIYTDNNTLRPIELTSDNIDGLFASYDIVLVNFYTEWCYYSQLLSPTYDEASIEAAKEFGNSTSKVLLAKVDCDDEKVIANRYGVNKYPTMKPVVFGKMLLEEYRGKRTVESIVGYIKHLVKDHITYVVEGREWENIDLDDQAITANFTDSNQPGYVTLVKVAKQLRNVCNFYVGFDEKNEQSQIISFKNNFQSVQVDSQVYKGSYSNSEELYNWAKDLCSPLTRELTFENAEELTEQGLPFLILFYPNNDTTNIKLFKKVLNSALAEEKSNFMFLTANAKSFSHPLMHVGKYPSDAPLILIDSFVHMYLFKKFNDIQKRGKLKKFIADFKSGELHREYHYGVDDKDKNEAEDGDEEENADYYDGEDENKANKKPTEPPKSIFKRLAPSKHRYSMRRDEL